MFDPESETPPAKDFGYPHELWTTRLLAWHARAHGPAEGHACLANLAQGTVCKILDQEDVKPHTVRYYLERRDPDFSEKMDRTSNKGRRRHTMEIAWPRAMPIERLAQQIARLRAMRSKAPLTPETALLYDLSRRSWTNLL